MWSDVMRVWNFIARHRNSPRRHGNQEYRRKKLLITFHLQCLKMFKSNFEVGVIKSLWAVRSNMMCGNGQNRQLILGVFMTEEKAFDKFSSPMSQDDSVWIWSGWNEISRTTSFKYDAKIGSKINNLIKNGRLPVGVMCPRDFLVHLSYIKSGLDNMLLHV